jgi:hypothetical protein
MRESCEMIAVFVEIAEHNGMREERAICGPIPVKVEVEREIDKRVRIGAITPRDAFVVPDNPDRIDLFCRDGNGELVWVHSYCPRTGQRG